MEEKKAQLKSLEETLQRRELKFGDKRQGPAPASMNQVPQNEIPSVNPSNNGTFEMAKRSPKFSTKTDPPKTAGNSTRMDSTDRAISRILEQQMSDGLTQIDT